MWAGFDFPVSSMQLPLLFNITAGGGNKLFRDCDLGAWVSGSRVSNLRFADDIRLLAEKELIYRDKVHGKIVGLGCQLVAY